MNYLNEDTGSVWDGFGDLLLALLVFAAVLSFTACKHTEKPIAAPVVAPAGPATAAVSPAVAAQDAADAAILSSIAASAAAITEINAGQPEGPRTDGVSNEAALIAGLAGEPTAADKLAASERARIVAEGKTEEIARAYAKAATEVEALKARADAADAALAKALTDAAAEQAALRAKYQAELNRLAAEGNARLKAAQDKNERDIRALQNKWVTIIFYGLGGLLTAAGIYVLLAGASVPMFGPKAGFAILGSGLGLAAVGTAINQVQNFLYRHPWVVGTGVAVCLVGLAVGVGMIISNHFHHKAETAV